MIRIIELAGTELDSNKKPIGHILKVLNEYDKILEGLPVYKILPSIYRGFTSSDEFYECPVFFNKVDLFSKLKRFLYKSQSIYNLYKKYQGDMFFFIFCDIYVLISLAILPIPRDSKVVILNYRHYNNNFIRSFFTKKAYKKAQRVITNRLTLGNMATHANYLLLPDYLYISDVYKASSPLYEKTVDFLIVGTLSSAKDIENVLEAVFLNNGRYTLKICGYFHDKKRYFLLKEKYNVSYIIIEDRVPENSEYLEMIRHARYTVLPYKKGDYTSRSSGVLYESLYLRTPVVSSDVEVFKILETNNMGYVYKNNFAEFLDNFHSIDYIAYQKNIDHFCNTNSLSYFQAEINQCFRETNTAAKQQVSGGER